MSELQYIVDRHRGSDRTFLGLSTDRPAARMREYLTVLGPLLRGESVDHRGETLTAVGAVPVPGAVPAPSVLVAAMGPRMVRLAGELADGTATWMTGPRVLAEHIVPGITAAAAGAGRPAPRIVAGLPVCLTDAEDDVRARIAEQFAIATQVPEYRATLDREGVAGPQDIAIVGTETRVRRALARLENAGVTEFMAVPFGTAAEQDRAVELLAGPPAGTGDPHSSVCARTAAASSSCISGGSV